MNWNVDEPIQHRLLGATILLILAAILMPALMHRAHHIYYRDREHPSTVTAEIAVHKEASKTIQFQSQQVAHVDLQHAVSAASSVEKLDTLTHAAQSSVKTVSHQKQNKRVNVPQTKPSVVSHAKTSVPLAKHPVRMSLGAQPQNRALVKSEAKFTVQLGSFASLANAEALVTQLKRQGYVAHYQKVDVNHVIMFKVTAGQVANRVEAEKLQKQLAQTNKIKGMIVRIGVN